MKGFLLLYLQYMRNKVLIPIFLVAIAAVAGWNISQSKSDATLSDVTLANVEALAQESGDVKCSTNCYLHQEYMNDSIPKTRKSSTVVEDALPTINNEKLQFIDNNGRAAKKLFVNDKEIKVKNINMDVGKIKQIDLKTVKNGDTHVYIYTE